MVEPKPPARSPFAPATIKGSSMPGWFGCGSIVGLLIFLFVLGLINPTMAAVVLVVGLGVGAFVFRKSIAASIGWGQAEIDVETHPLLLGTETAVRYRRQPRKPRDVPSCQVRFQLVCEEVVTYRQGTDTKTAREDVVDQSVLAPGSGTPRGLEAAATVAIPATAGAPTFDLGHNEVSWTLRVSVDGPGLPTDEQRFPIEVTAALDPALRATGNIQPRPEDPR